ncbi:MAG: VOC family protein [Caulobacteraceae bacterium]|nr:VOC family protein [Caulobacteraceae bacterium]
MIGYTMLGTSDLARARTFYDPLVTLLGAEVVEAYTSETRVWYGRGAKPAMLVITLPHDGRGASAGNGTMVALIAASRDVVDRVHAKALELGGADEGPPGVRGDDPDGFYGAYFRDPDGNKLAVFRVGPA